MRRERSVRRWHSAPIHRQAVQQRPEEHAIAELLAAQATLDKRGMGHGQSGDEARRGMETRKRVGEERAKEIAAKLVDEALVLLGWSKRVAGYACCTAGGRGRDRAQASVPAVQRCRSAFSRMGKGVEGRARGRRAPICGRGPHGRGGISHAVGRAVLSA